MASDLTLAAAVCVFVLTYVLISLRQVAQIPLERPAAALLGAALMLLLGVLGPAEALAAINVDVLLLLIGMMLLVSGLEVCGFFDLVSTRISSRAGSGGGLLAGIMVAGAVLSALVLNDTIALLMTPIVVKSARSVRANPVPYLVALAIAVNVGSVATEIGNPQNAYIGIRSGIPFLTFAAYLLPVAAACLAVAFVLVWAVFRRDLRRPLERVANPTSARLHRRGLGFTLAVVLGCVAGFLLTTPDWLPFIALAGGAFVLFILPFLVPTTPRTMIQGVDWGIIVFFIGLFVVLGGVEVSGLSSYIQAGFTAMFGGEGGLGWLTGLSALLSNLISNVPAVFLLSEVVEASGGSTQLWLALAASSTLAGNATILGAAANVIVVQTASRHGVQVSMKDFVKAGLPVTAATLLLSTLLIALLVPP
ncbi:MAG: hypothetical protein A3K68_01835 [Euryarchaeota archaeon RBG_16_68_13]|nr:MAG: hypothetical protein A3K68_01835 [Euryarchaeota archaeon RBG_16_68_13]